MHPAAKERNTPASASTTCLPQTRVWASTAKNSTVTGGCSPLTSTCTWACGFAYDETAVVSLVNRYYDPARGRFTTADPSSSGKISDPLSWNRYAYTRGDPINFNDPTGLDDDPVATFSVTTWLRMNRVGGGGGGDHPYLTAARGVEEDTAGGGDGSLMVKNLAKSGKKYDRVANTFKDILGSIDSDCLGFLQSGGNNVQSYVSDLLSSNLLAVGDFTTTIAAFTGTGNTSLAPGDAAIVVNNNSAFFNSNYTVDQGKLQGGTAEGGVFILLHELGHALGANGFQSDYNNKSAGTANDKLIDQNCQKTLSKFQ